MASIAGLSHLSNPLATPAQLQISASQLDGIPADLEVSIRFESAKLIQAAGILLRLSQDIIAQAIILSTRFWIGPDGGSMLRCAPIDIVPASLYLVAKPLATPVSPRQLLSVMACLAKAQPRIDLETISSISPEDCVLSEGGYYDARAVLFEMEAQLLRTLGYQTHVALPYALCINYLQTLEVFNTSEKAQDLSKRAFAHLNSALLSPQLLYLTHQPCALATSAIYLAAKEIGVKLPDNEWWEVFDVDREELGFLVVAMISMPDFADEERRKWSQSSVPMTDKEVKEELPAYKMTTGGK